MTDERTTERHPTDEPDGTTAHAASLRPPGANVAGAPDDEDGADVAVDPHTGYDPEAVSGDTAAYRPE